jgi:hypothetical protein
VPSSWVQPYEVLWILLVGLTKSSTELITKGFKWLLKGRQVFCERLQEPLPWTKQRSFAQAIPRSGSCFNVARTFRTQCSVEALKPYFLCASLQILNVTGSNILVLFRPGFWFVLSPGPTIASSLYLAKRTKWASLEEKAKIEHVEVCPSALKLTAEVAWIMVTMSWYQTAYRLVQPLSSDFLISVAFSWNISGNINMICMNR